MQRALQLLYFVLFHHLGRFLLRARVEIHAEVVSLQRPLVIAANHENRFDPFLLVLLPWKVVRRIVPLAFPTGQYFDQQPWLWRLLQAFGAYHLPRYAWSLEEYLESTIDQLKKKRSVMIFPEGRVGTSGTARPGVGFLATKLRCVIVPVSLSGTAELSLSNLWRRRLRVEMHVGKPLTFAPESDAAKAAQEVMDAIYERRAWHSGSPAHDST